jgi:hypothetical protein
LFTSRRWFLAGRGSSSLISSSSGAAAFGVSFLFWRIFCASPQRISGRRGALVGLLTGVFAHPVAWYLAIVWFYAGMSLLLMGWLTVPAGGMVGWILGKVLQPRVP